MISIQDWVRSIGFTDFEKDALELNDDVRKAAFGLYTELSTRITTQSLSLRDGDEKAALTSIFKLFEITRKVIHDNGFCCMEFCEFIKYVLNEEIRPFTAKWHKLSLESAFSNPKKCRKFRKELTKLQSVLIVYTQMLGEMAGVEDDLTTLEDE